MALVTVRGFTLTDFQRLVLILSRNTKENLTNRLKSVYGEDFKSPLARELGVNVSTIRRIFNQKDDIPLVYKMAIEGLLSKKKQAVDIRLKP